MADPDNIEQRVSALEAEVSRLREQVTLTATDAGAVRVLASGADHDVAEVRAELRAHTQALNALRETQLEQGHAIAELQHGQNELRDTVHTGFAKVNAGMTAIHALLERIADQDG